MTCSVRTDVSVRAKFYCETMPNLQWRLVFIQGTHSRIGGVTFDILAKEAFERHQITYWKKPMDMLVIRNPGMYHWRSGGEKHINDPDSIANLQVNTPVIHFIKYRRHIL